MYYKRMNRIEARKIIIKATNIMVPRLQAYYKTDDLEKICCPLSDIRRLIMIMRLPNTDMRYKKYETFFPCSITFDELEAALSVLPDKMLTSGIAMGLRRQGVKISTNP